MFIGVLVENTRRNASDADFLREPVRKLNVVIDSPRSDTAPVAHDQIASLRFEDLETGFVENLEHAVALGLVHDRADVSTAWFRGILRSV